METIKLGSKGEHVKALQKALGMDLCDGVAGSQTVAAICLFQKQKGMVVDGIAGAKTLAALGLTSTSVVTVKKPLTFGLTPSANRSIKYLVIHFTAGSHSRKGKALACFDVWKASKKASADFAVDDVDIVQFNTDPRNKYCWAVGGSNYNNKGGRLYGIARNSNCISIEICSTCTPSTQKAVTTDNHKGWSFTEAALDNARKLARELMAKYNIDLAHVIRHYDVTGKLCPGVYGWNDEPLKDTQGNRTGEHNNSQLWQQWKNSL